MSKYKGLKNWPATRSVADAKGGAGKENPSVSKSWRVALLATSHR